MTTGRRRFLGHLTAGAVSAAVPVRAYSALPKFARSPFQLGIASGDPTDSSVILWTRLAPAPLELAGGMSDVAVPVDWQVARDEGFRQVVRHGTVLAEPELAHSVHVDVQGLTPYTEYWYRFRAGGVESEVGRTLTLPEPGESPAQTRFVTCSCQHYEQGYFSAYTHMLDDAPDFVVHLGDYIYDVSFGPGVRTHGNNDPLITVDDFRMRHALYKTDQSLRAAHRHLPFFAIPDNHDALQDNDTRRLAVRAAAYQAWYEHMPVRVRYRPDSAALSLYKSVEVGNLLRLNLLDTRQFRSTENISQGDPDYAFGIFRPDVPARLGSDRHMLGTEQAHWLRQRLTNSPATWNVVASTVPVGEFELRRGSDPTPHYYYSSWDGYPASRAEMFDALRQTQNPVVLSGDIHSFWCKDLIARVDGKDQTIATEFTTSSISAGWPAPLAEPIADNLTRNPATRFYEPNDRGYALHEVSSSRWSTVFRGLDSVEKEASSPRNIKNFELFPGRGGAQIS